MNDTNVLDRLSEEWDALTPAAQKAARYVLENPQQVGVSTVRGLAEAADVTPNTLVRMAQQVGFDGFADFQEPFRAAIRDGSASFPDRARWLQEQAGKGALGALYADMVGSALRNIEETFAGIEVAHLQSAAETIWNARQIYTVGVGVNSSNAQNFTYLASTGMGQFHAIPRMGSTAVDDLARASDQDVLIAITCRPYRAEVVAAVEVAREQGLTVIGISDSPASPVIRGSAHSFVVASDTPQFFPSSVATITLLETLLSFVIGAASPEIVQRVERFHARRHALGIYAGDSA
ncbi:Transcriptional regulator, RpiR family [Candidatus Rhodobacter oscarellae]|uniref:Transcriptional regulator, RpiR family n=1 Tax=Candidatus Rhodobacter oscarellae TaxID=1675527 RepID=A0A0J9E9N1_9RHOB|nr:MurR/RpiR family transcriptional regulator [Candidatus Rhodobacter lobularis]KMW59336.1 Transcriptional regulator, RpiR family [Candidatus Rhodobacter lobularis]